MPRELIPADGPNLTEGVRSRICGNGSPEEKAFSVACMLVEQKHYSDLDLTERLDELSNVVAEPERTELEPLLPLITPRMLELAERHERRQRAKAMLSALQARARRHARPQRAFLARALSARA